MTEVWIFFQNFFQILDCSSSAQPEQIHSKSTNIFWPAFPSSIFSTYFFPCRFCKLFALIFFQKLKHGKSWVPWIVFFHLSNTSFIRSLPCLPDRCVCSLRILLICLQNLCTVYHNQSLPHILTNVVFSDSDDMIDACTSTVPMFTFLSALLYWCFGCP